MPGLGAGTPAQRRAVLPGSTCAARPNGANGPGHRATACEREDPAPFGRGRHPTVKSGTSPVGCLPPRTAPTG